MTEIPRRPPGPPVLVLAPTVRDAALTEEMLVRAGVNCVCCHDFNEVLKQLDEATGALVLPEESLPVTSDGRLQEQLQGQPAWSDLPVIVLARPGADSAATAQAMESLGNVIILERPMRVASLVSTVRTALRARQRQFQIREHLVQRARAEGELRANDRRKDEFLAMLAHELRNPLAPIRNSLHILRLTESPDAASRGVGAMMERQVNQMVRLVDDLMEVSRITRGKIDLHLEGIDIAGVVRNAIETSRPLVEQGGHTLHLSLPTTPLLVLCDPVRMAQVISNLLNNASKYTEPGGSIWVGARRVEQTVEITVRDSGMGIPPEMLPRIFDLFTQVDQHSTHAQGGLGIGLTLVKSIIELHHGSIIALSDGPGQGSEFVITLPLPEPSTREPSTGAAPSVPGRMPKRRVLVVDDNKDAGQSLGTLLELLGSEVQVVYSGTEALTVIPLFKPAIVLLDIGMPGMDGHEVVRRIREQSAFHDLVVIALTGWGQDEDRRLSREAGFDYHLVKPADVSALQLLFRSIDAALTAEAMSDA